MDTYMTNTRGCLPQKHFPCTASGTFLCLLFWSSSSLVVQFLCRLSKDSFSSTSILAGMQFIWKADYANEHTINFCSSTFFPLQRLFFLRLTLWCKTHQQPRSWYVNFTCQTEGMLRTSIAELFPWWEETVFTQGWKTWFTNSRAICCGIIRSLLALDQLLLYTVQLSFGKHRLPASTTQHRTEKGKEWQQRNSSYLLPESRPDFQPNTCR